MEKMAIIIAGGGTGGHLFPGIAIAEELLKRNPDNRVLFIGTNRGLEKKVLGRMGFALKTINVEGLKGRGILKVVNSLMKIPGSLLESYRIIRSFRPDVVAGVGGYASGPAVLAARMMGIKTVIAEQNAVPGLTNRILGHFVHRVFVTFPDSRRFFPEGKTAVTGNPVRISFLKEAEAIVDIKLRFMDTKLRFMNTKLRFHEFPLRNRPFTILIFGGSQGARAINRKVVESLDSLVSLKGDIHFIHQTGESDRQSVEDAYQKRGFSAEVYPFIIDMAETYNRADLLLCRAGATSLSEITAVGKASILIPLPSAAGDHQTKNALQMEKAGASVMIPEKSLDGPKLAQEIERLYRKRETIETMEAAAASLGRKDAAATIVDMIMKLR